MDRSFSSTAPSDRGNSKKVPAPQYSKKQEATKQVPVVIFDMDGILVDSNDTWDLVMGKIFASYGKSLSDFDKSALVGGDNSLQWGEHLREFFACADSAEEIVDHVVGEMIAQYERHLPLIPGAADIVANLAPHFSLGLASSSPREIIAFILKRSGLEKFLHTWVSSDDVNHGKPTPDVYLHCCELMGVAPENALAVEDSRVGIWAAKAAGMKVIAIPQDSFPLGVETIALADLVLSSIKELTRESIIALF